MNNNPGNLDTLNLINKISNELLKNKLLTDRFIKNNEITRNILNIEPIPKVIFYFNRIIFKIFMTLNFELQPLEQTYLHLRFL